MFEPHRKHNTSPLRAQQVANPNTRRVISHTTHPVYVTIRSIGLQRRYINITVTILDIIHRPVFYLKHTMDNVRTSQKTRYVSTTEPSQLMLCKI
jgi:hypothetical protein